MFAVYRRYFDGCNFNSRTVLFVTASERTAKDSVTLAELELVQALSVPQPVLTPTDVMEKGAGYVIRLREDYDKKLVDFFTVDVISNWYDTYANNTYYYAKVEVR